MLLEDFRRWPLTWFGEKCAQRSLQGKVPGCSTILINHLVQSIQVTWEGLKNEFALFGRWQQKVQKNSFCFLPLLLELDLWCHSRWPKELPRTLSPLILPTVLQCSGGSGTRSFPSTVHSFCVLISKTYSSSLLPTVQVLAFFLTLGSEKPHNGSHPYGVGIIPQNRCSGLWASIYFLFLEILEGKWGFLSQWHLWKPHRSGLVPHPEFIRIVPQTDFSATLREAGTLEGDGDFKLRVYHTLTKWLWESSWV